MAATDATTDRAVETAVRKAMWRLLPFLGLCYLQNYVDFLGPYLTGWLQELTGSFRAGMFVVAGFMLLAAVIVLLLRPEPTPVEATSSGADTTTP